MSIQPGRGSGGLVGQVIEWLKPSACRYRKRPDSIPVVKMTGGEEAGGLPAAADILSNSVKPVNYERYEDLKQSYDWDRIVIKPTSLSCVEGFFRVSNAREFLLWAREEMRDGSDVLQTRLFDQVMQTVESSAPLTEAGKYQNSVRKNTDRNGDLKLGYVIQPAFKPWYDKREDGKDVNLGGSDFIFRPWEVKLLYIWEKLTNVMVCCKVFHKSTETGFINIEEEEVNLAFYPTPSIGECGPGEQFSLWTSTNAKELVGWHASQMQTLEKAIDVTLELLNAGRLEAAGKTVVMKTQMPFCRADFFVDIATKNFFFNESQMNSTVIFFSPPDQLHDLTKCLPTTGKRLPTTGKEWLQFLDDYGSRIDSKSWQTYDSAVQFVWISGLKAAQRRIMHKLNSPVDEFLCNASFGSSFFEGIDNGAGSCVYSLKGSPTYGRFIEQNNEFSLRSEDSEVKRYLDKSLQYHAISETDVEQCFVYHFAELLEDYYDSQTQLCNALLEAFRLAKDNMQEV